MSCPQKNMMVMQDTWSFIGTEAHLLSTETHKDWIQCAASTRLILPHGRFQVGRASDPACCSTTVVHWNFLPNDHCLMCRPLLPEGSDEDDVRFCNRITVEAGVTALPVKAVITQHSTCVLIHTHTGMFLLQSLLSLPLWAEIVPRHVHRHVASRGLCLTSSLRCR